MASYKIHFTVFEHDTLWVGQSGFTESHRKQLEAFYGNGSPYFRLVHKGVRFSHYVGVLQIGRLTIEILPKVNKASAAGNEVLWQRFLLRMLQTAGVLPKATENADLKLHAHSILEIYFTLFLEQVRYLVQTGLTRQYRSESGNTNALKGRLLFAEQLRHNSVHAERFFTRHTVYDTDHIHNAILLQTLKLIARMGPTALLRSEATALQTGFPECRQIQITEETFDRLVYNRKTEGYRMAHGIARLLLLRYHPDVQGGNNDVLALLFNMNALWEAYVFERLRRQLSVLFGSKYVLRKQVSTPFWKPVAGSMRQIYPDIVVALRSQPEQPLLVLDTKWKCPEKGVPAESDLRQMLAYNLFQACERSALVYPTAGKEETVRGVYANPVGTCCALLFLPLQPALGILQIDLSPVVDLILQATETFPAPPFPSSQRLYLRKL